MAMAVDPGRERFDGDGDASSPSPPLEPAEIRFESLSLSEPEERPPAVLVDMESRIWSKLPDHLVENILARLPFWSVLRFRSACRRWRTLSIANPSPDPILAVFADYGDPGRSVGAYDCSRGRWLMIPLARILGMDSGDAPPLIVAGAGGLFCADHGAGSPRRTLLVANFLTGKRRNLPPIPHMRCAYVAGMSVHPSSPSSSSYRVLVVADSRGRLVSQCYDSTAGSWKMGGILNHMVALIITTVLLGNTLYCLTFGPSGLLAYHTEMHTWEIVKIAMPPLLVCPHVFEHDGKLLLAGGLEEYGVLNRIQIWRLDGGGGSESGVCIWVEVLCMPDLLFQKLFPRRKGHFFCVGQRGLICFADNNSPTILMCDLNACQWRWIPPCPLDYTARRHDPSMHMLGFSIEPRFDALV